MRGSITCVSLIVDEKLTVVRSVGTCFHYELTFQLVQSFNFHAISALCKQWQSKKLTNFTRFSLTRQRCNNKHPRNCKILFLFLFSNTEIESDLQNKLEILASAPFHLHICSLSCQGKQEKRQKKVHEDQKCLRDIVAAAVGSKIKSDEVVLIKWRQKEPKSHFPIQHIDN